MRKSLLMTMLLSSALFVACSNDTRSAERPNPSSDWVVPDGKGSATPAECKIFDNNPVVVSRVKFKTEKDYTDLAITYEFVGGNLKTGYVDIELDKEEYERLKVIGAMRNWKVEINKEATKKHSESHRIVENGGVAAQSISKFPCYRTVEETYQTMNDLAAKYPDLVTVKNLGKAWAGQYDIKVLIIGNKDKKKNTRGKRPQVVMTSSIHAREYTPAELHTRLAEWLLENYGKDANATWMIDSQDMHFILQANPEGRKKAEAGSLWRKNINNTDGCKNSTYGVDLNRNFDVFWGQGGSSKDPCSQTYMGSGPASEPETKLYQRYLEATFGDHRGPGMNDKAPDDTMGIYMDTHSYAQLVLWSWGHVKDLAPNGRQLASLGRKFGYFNGYKPTPAIGLYPTTGTTEDYGYGKLGIPSYTIELGTAFFESCSTFENNVIPKNMPALRYAISVARAPYKMGSGADVIDLETRNSNGQLELVASADSTRFNNSNGKEPSRNVVSAEYFVDTPPWEGGQAIPMQASDGSFNSGKEKIKATLNLSKGKHIIYVRAKSNTHYGPVNAIYVEGTGDGGGGGDQVYEGSVNTNSSSFQPNSKGFNHSGGQLSAQLSSSASGDFDLYLQKKEGVRWIDVDSSANDSHNESISYNGTSGLYRWEVYAYEGSGRYKITTKSRRR